MVAGGPSMAADQQQLGFPPGWAGEQRCEGMEYGPNQRCSVGLGEQVMLAPGLAPVRGIEAGLFPAAHGPHSLVKDPARCPRKPGTSPGGPHRAIGTTAFRGASITLRLAANPAAGASRACPVLDTGSSRNHNPSLGAASPANIWRRAGAYKFIEGSS